MQRRGVFRGLIVVASTLLFLLAVAATVPNRLWIPELISSFGWQLSVAALAIGILGLVGRIRLGAAIALAAAIGLAGPSLLCGRAARGGASDPHRPLLRLLLVNALSENEQSDQLLDAILRVDADLIILTEPPSALLRGLMRQDAGSGVTLRAKPTQGEHSWLVVCSRYPATLSGEPGDGVLMCRVVGPWGPLDLVACHLLSPRTLNRFSETSRQADRIVASVSARAEDGAPLVIAGDLNAAPGSQTSRFLASRTRTARAAPILGAGTYPSHWPEPVRVSIDDALVSAQIKVEKWTRLRLPGSDHWGVVVELSLPPSLGEPASANNLHAPAYEADRRSEEGSGPQE